MDGHGRGKLAVLYLMVAAVLLSASRLTVALTEDDFPNPISGAVVDSDNDGDGNNSTRDGRSYVLVPVEVPRAAAAAPAPATGSTSPFASQEQQLLQSLLFQRAKLEEMKELMRANRRQKHQQMLLRLLSGDQGQGQGQYQNQYQDSVAYPGFGMGMGMGMFGRGPHHRMGNGGNLPLALTSMSQEDLAGLAAMLSSRSPAPNPAPVVAASANGLADAAAANATRQAAGCPGRRIDGRFGNHGYMFSWLAGLPKMNWNNARGFCRSQCMDLVSIETAAENQYIKSIITPAWQQGFINYIWTSGSRSGNGFFWSATGVPIPGPGQPGSDWASDQPNNREGAENCMAFLNPSVYDDPSGQFTWHDISCHYEKPFICEEL